MSKQRRDRAISRRTVLHLASTGAIATALASMPGLSRAQAVATVEQAVEWARKNLPNSTPDIVNGAAKEGKLVLTMQLHADEKGTTAMINKFKERYPFVDATFTLQNSSQVMKKFNAEWNAKKGISDFIHLPSNLLSSKQLIDDGAIAKFVISREDLFPKFAMNSGVWYPILEQHGVTAYRVGALSDEEKQLVRTYEGLTDPRFSGRIGIVGSNTSNGRGGCYILMYGPDPSIWEGLVANKPQVKPASSPLTDGLLRGEYDVALMDGFSIAARTAQSGGPLEFVISNPSPVTYAPGAISAMAPNPNAAKLWQDWTMSEEAQNLHVDVSGAISAMKGAKLSWSEQQAWFHQDRSGQIPMPWDDFSAKQKDVIERYKKDLQAG